MAVKQHSFKLDENSDIEVVFEVDELPATGRQAASRNGGSLKSPKTWSEALEVIKPAANKLLETVRNLDMNPDQVEVAFGIKISADVGAVFAKASTEGNFNVKLTWKVTENTDPTS